MIFAKRSLEVRSKCYSLAYFSFSDGVCVFTGFELFTATVESNCTAAVALVLGLASGVLWVREPLETEFLTNLSACSGDIQQLCCTNICYSLISLLKRFLSVKVNSET